MTSSAAVNRTNFASMPQIDFSKKPTPITPVNIQGFGIETVEEYKYLVVHLNNKLDWSTNTNALYRKGLS